MSALFFFFLLAKSLHVTGGTNLARHETDRGNDHPHLLHWLETTNAELIFIGDLAFGPKAPADILTRAAQVTGFVTYCNVRTPDNKCGGTRTVYAGGPACVSAPHTACYYVSSNFQNAVSACGGSGCTGGCYGYSQCATRLSDGFCYAPGTQSILVTIQ